MYKRMNEINSRKAEIRGLLQGSEQIDLDEVQAELEALEAEERSIQKRIEIAGKINAGEVRGLPMAKAPEAQKEVGTDSMEYRKAFMEYVLRGKQIPIEMRADAFTTTSDVGVVIPETVLNRIVEKIEATGMILSRVTRTAIKGGVTVPVSTVKPVATFVAERATSDKQEKTVSGSVTFAYHKLRCAVAVSLEVDTIALPIFEAALVQQWRGSSAPQPITPHQGPSAGLPTEH